MVVVQSGILVHYWRTNTGDTSDDQVVSSKPSSAGTIIQSTLHSTRNFEVLILQGESLVHYCRDNSNISAGFLARHVVSAKATGAGTFIQGTFGRFPKYNFEAAVLEGNNLVHYYGDNTNRP